MGPERAPQERAEIGGGDEHCGKYDAHRYFRDDDGVGPGPGVGSHGLDDRCEHARDGGGDDWDHRKEFGDETGFVGDDFPEQRVVADERRGR